MRKCNLWQVETCFLFFSSHKRHSAVPRLRVAVSKTKQTLTLLFSLLPVPPMHPATPLTPPHAQHSKCTVNSLLGCREELLLGSHFRKQRGGEERSVRRGEDRRRDSRQGRAFFFFFSSAPTDQKPARPPALPLHRYTHLPALLSEICQNTFHTNRYFFSLQSQF